MVKTPINSLIYFAADPDCHECAKVRTILKAAGLSFCEYPVRGIADPEVISNGQRYDGLRKIIRALLLGLIQHPDIDSDELPNKIIENLVR